MNSNLKKLFGFATIAACTFGFAMNVNAAATVTDGVCKSDAEKGVDRIKECLKKEDVTSIDLESVTADLYETINIKGIELKGTVNVYSKGKLTIDKDLTGPVTVKFGGAVEAAKVTGNVTLDGKDGGATMTAKEIVGTVNVSEKAKLTVTNTEGKGITGNVTVTTNGSVEVTSKGDGITGDVTLGESGKKTSKGTLTVTSYIKKPNQDDNTANAIDGALSMYGESVATIKDGNLALDAATLANTSKLVASSSEVSFAATSAVNDDATMTAKEITGENLTVNGEGAVVETLAKDTDVENDITLTKGTVKVAAVDQKTGKDIKVVTVAGVKTVELNAGDKYVIADVTEADAYEINAKNGALIENTSEDNLKVTLNGKEVEIEKKSTLTVGGVVDPDPVDPTDPTDPTDPSDKPNTGDDQPNKNPQTFDGILSYVGVALSSVGGLGVSLKKRLFR